jgi:hypothetical protein
MKIANFWSLTPIVLQYSNTISREVDGRSGGDRPKHWPENPVITSYLLSSA